MELINEHIKNRLYDVLGESLSTDIIINEITISNINDMYILTVCNKIIYSYDIDITIDVLIYLLISRINKDIPIPDGKYIILESYKTHWHKKFGLVEDDMINYNVLYNPNISCLLSIDDYIQNNFRGEYTYNTWSDDETELNYNIITSDEALKYAMYVLRD